MKKIKYIILLVILGVGLSSCDKNAFENKFDKLPDERMQETITEYKNLLASSEFGWELTYSVGSGIEYVVYNIAYFNKDNTVSLKSRVLDDAIESEYKIFSEADVELVFNTFNINLTSQSYPNAKAPNGLGGDIEFNFVSVSEDKSEIVLEGKVYKGILKLKKAASDLSDFTQVNENVKLLGQQRTARYMNLAITSGLGATETKPVSIGLDLSSIAAVGDYNYNYKGEYFSGRKMLYFDHDGMGLSTPIKIENSEIQYFTYNAENKRYELTNSDLKGYLYCTKRPTYFKPGVYKELLSGYSLKMKQIYGEVRSKYLTMKNANPVIKSVVVVTDYKQRIPLFDKDGKPVLDSSLLPDYENGSLLGEGLLFSFEFVNQFYFYFVPIEMIKLEEDRLKIKRLSGEFCSVKKGDDATSIGNLIKNNKEFNEFVDYLCNDDGWLISRKIEAGIIDWDFVSLDNADNMFIGRLY